MRASKMLMMTLCALLLGLCATVSSGSGQEAEKAQEPKPRPPHFNHKMRQFLIEGSYNIIPLEPLKVGNRRQLLMDDYVVDDAWGCRRVVHSPEKHPQNPLIPATVPGLLEVGEGTVMFDEALQRFRLWSIRFDMNAKSIYDGNYAQRYFESRDGIRWEKPNLGIVEDAGSKENNLIRGGKGSCYDVGGVVKVPPRLQARGKYAMFYGYSPEKTPAGQPHNMEERVAWSEDGIHWKDQPENPVFRGRDDVFRSMVYNPARDVFMLYRRPSVNANEIRRTAYSESRDLVSWTQPRVVILPDDLDPPMHYGFAVTEYQGVFFGLLQMFYVYPTVVPTKTKYGFLPQYAGFRDGPKALKIDLQLAWSRDGLRWERHPERPTFLPTGLPGSYDWGMILGYQGMPEAGDRIHVYYCADEAFHIGEDLKKSLAGHLCLATLRKDGFVSLDAPEQGYVLTKPLLCPGGRLHINARVRPGGFVRVAARRGDGVKDGNWIEGWGYDEGTVFIGDSTDAVMEWKGRENLDELKGKSVRLHFWLWKAELYSFWLE